MLGGLNIGDMINSSGKKPNMGTLNKMMGLLSKLNNTNESNTFQIKDEMDKFLQNDLGIDTLKLHEHINKSNKL